MNELKWRGVFGVLLMLSGAVECGNTGAATKEAQGKACATSCSPSAGSNAQGTGRHLRYGLEHFSGNLRLWDDATVYTPEYGPWTSFELSLTPGAATPGLWHGGWNFSAVSYVTTEWATTAGTVRLYGRGGGYETARANEGSACSATTGTRCTYPPDAMSKHRLDRPGGQASALSVYPAAVRALVTDGRGFVRALPDGRYEVYGGSENAIRVVSGGYEAWLSATVSRSGLVLRWQYERVGDRLRLQSLVDATGLTTRLYYADNEPRFSKVRGFIAELIASQPQVGQLNTSVHDPYGRVTQYAYQDLLTGLALGELPGTSDGALHAAIRDRSRHWRLLALQDVLGVRSQVRYACGSTATVDTTQVASSVAELETRAAMLRAHACLAGSGSSVGFGEQAFDPQWTETPYGVTRFTRIRIGALATEEQRRGWIVESPNGDVERVEANFGVISASLEGAMRALVSGSPTGAMPNVGTLLGSRPGHVPVQDWDRLAGLTLSDGERTSLHWTHKAADDLVQTGRVSGFAALRDPATRLPLSHAHVRQYLHDHALGESDVSTSPLLVAEKAPLEGWVFYGYQGAASADTFRNSSMHGSTAAASKPTLTVRGLADGAVQATYVAYGAQGLPTLMVDAVGRAQELVYAANGVDLVAIHAARWNALAADGSRLTRLKRLSHNEYNSRGQLQRTEDASGEVTTFGYQTSAPYLLESVTDAVRARTTRFTRAVLNPGAAPSERVLHYTTQDPDGFLTTADYQQGWLIGREADGVSYRWSGHDAFGRPQYYAVDGRVRAVYAYQGLTLTGVTNPVDGTQVEIQSDHLGRTAWMGLSNSANELLRSWYYDYDAGGGLRSLWDGRGQAMRWEYDVQGRPLSFEDSDGVRQTLGYDAQVSRVNRTTDARGISSYLSYTAAGELQARRLHSATAPPVLSLVYDPVYTRVTQMVEGAGTTTYRYHPTLPYRVLGSTQPLSGGGVGAATQMLLTFDYTLGRRTGWQAQDNLAASAQSWQEMRFDPRDRVERITSELFGAFPRYAPTTSAAMGRIEAIGYDLTREVSGARVDEVTQHIGYADVAHERRMNERRYESIAGAAQTVFEHIDFDENDRIWRSQGLIGGSENNYHYDAAGQLQREQRSRFGASGTREIESDVGYGYDELGNRTEVTTLGANGMPIAQQVAATYDDGNRLSSVQRGSTTRSAQYDAAGNLTFDPGNGYGYRYNDDNRLDRISYKAGDYTQLTYNAAGQVVRVQEYYANVLSDDRTNVYDADGQWIQQRNTADMRLMRTLNGDGYAEHTLNANGKPVVERYLILRNHLGSAIGRIDAQGRVVERVDYSAWGEPARRQLRGAVGNLVNTPILQTAMPIGYAGYALHHRSGLYLTHYRVYAPKLGRFTQKDPIGIAGGHNLYAYVANNPVSFSDPSGLNPRDPLRCAAAALELISLRTQLATRHADLSRQPGAPILPGSAIYRFSAQTGNALSGYQNLLDAERAAVRELVAACSDSEGPDGRPVDELLADGLQISGEPEVYVRSDRSSSVPDWVSGPDGVDVYVGNRSPWAAGAALAGVGAMITAGSMLTGTGETVAAGAGIATLATAAFVGLVDLGAWLEGQARAAVW